MNPLVYEWLRKAEVDWLTAGREIAAQRPNYDAVCFHVQRCAEEYLKAQLQKVSLAFRKPTTSCG